MENEQKPAYNPQGGPSMDDTKIISAVGYLGILCLLPLLLKKEDAFAQHHGKQGLVLLICWVALSLVSWFPILGWMVGLFGGMALIVLMILGILKSLAGEMWVMPILGKYAEQIKL